MFQDITLVGEMPRASSYIERVIVKNSRKIFFILVGYSIVFIFIFCLLWIFACSGQKSAEYGVMRKIIRVVVWNENVRIVLEQTSGTKNGSHAIREPEWDYGVENSHRPVNMLGKRQRIVFREVAKILMVYNERCADQLSRMAIWLKEERQSNGGKKEKYTRVIYDLCEVNTEDIYPPVEDDFPKGMVEEISDAFRENTLMEFIKTHAAEYKVLSSREIEHYAASSDTVVKDFIEFMEWENSHRVVRNEIKFEKREEKIKEVSETDAIWYMLPVNGEDTVVVYGKYWTYKFELRFASGHYLWGKDVLYFISWGENNVIIEADEDLKKVNVIFFGDDGDGIMYDASLTKTGNGEINIEYGLYNWG